NGFLRKQPEFERDFGGIRKLLETFAVGFGPLVTSAQQCSGEPEALATKAYPIEARRTNHLRRLDFHGFGDFVISGEGICKVGAPGELGPKIRFSFDLASKQFRVEQTGEHAVEGLAAVLDP